MDCFFPGRVLVGPSLEGEGGAHLADSLRKEFGSDFEYELGVEDILRGNKVDVASLKYRRFLPFVGRVPEGAEADIAGRISRFSKEPVGAATPDYLVRPAAPIAIDKGTLEKALKAIRAMPGGSQCGRSTRVGILDSGVDPSLVPNGNVELRQFDALSPTGAGGALTDQLGHGSLVARIVSDVVPSAKLISIRSFSQTGTVSSVVAGLYLAQAAGPCDVLNLSFSVNCAPVPCAVCRTPALAAMNIGQLGYFFETFMKGAPNTVLVAAAGNNVQHLVLPAAFDQVIAVGSFDHLAGAPISSYHQVPTGRYVLAPGGRGVAGSAFAQRPGFNSPDYLHGTSFAAAFVSGFAAKVKCAQSGGCGTPLRSPTAALGSSLYSAVVAEIAACSDTSWMGFDPARHGLDAISF